jgi:oligosaccharyltransferase complex subunit gamma
MRLSSIPLAAFAAASATLAYAQDAAHWASIASKAKDGIIKLDSASYEAILNGGPGKERDYSVLVELTAMGSQFKCQPCQ